MHVPAAYNKCCFCTKGVHTTVHSRMQFEQRLTQGLSTVHNRVHTPLIWDRTRIPTSTLIVSHHKTCFVLYAKISPGYHIPAGWFSGLNGSFHSAGLPGVGGKPFASKSSSHDMSFSQA